MVKLKNSKIIVATSIAATLLGSAVATPAIAAPASSPKSFGLVQAPRAITTKSGIDTSFKVVLKGAQAQGVKVKWQGSLKAANNGKWETLATQKPVFIVKSRSLTFKGTYVSVYDGAKIRAILTKGNHQYVTKPVTLTVK